MTTETLERVYEEVFKSEQIRDPITFLWHAGEPLAVGHEFYSQAFDLCNSVNQKYNRVYVQNIQTNATLIDAQWIEIFKQHSVLLGVSLDGPAFIHDKNRVARNGKGTHERVMRGVRLLQDGGVNFEVIMVLTRAALDYPDEIFHFFVDNGIKSIGFNIDEVEGVHDTSSYTTCDAEEKYHRFMYRFLELLAQHPGSLKVREFHSMLPVLLYPDIALGNGEGFNNTNTPMQILTINYMGDYSTFCPELSGTRSEKYDDFVMGNVFTQPIDSIYKNAVFQKVNEEIQQGVQHCQAECGYWSLCGGGSPANKYFETGHLNTSETMHCKIHVKALTNTILEFFENELA